MDGASVAFGKVLENLQKKTYSFRSWIEQEGKVSQESHAMVMEPGLIRWTMEDNSASPFYDAAIVVDAINKKIVWISKKGAIIGETELPKNAAFELWTESIINLWGLRDGDEENIGTQEINGAEVFGFKVYHRIEGGSLDIIVWANIETKRPEQVEIILFPDNSEDTGKIKVVLSDFNYDIEVDPALFGLSDTQSDASKESDSFIIRPGEGIGKLQFGMSVEQMKEIMGEPDMVLGETVFQYPGFALTAPRDQKVTGIMCGDPNPADSSRVAECRCKTTEKIGIGSSENEIIAAYGQPSLRRPGPINNSIELIYRDMRMKFLLYEDKVAHMTFGPKK